MLRVLVGRIVAGQIESIKHHRYVDLIAEHGGVDSLIYEILAAVDPLVMALQGRDINREEYVNSYLAAPAPSS